MELPMFWGYEWSGGEGTANLEETTVEGNNQK